MIVIAMGWLLIALASAGLCFLLAAGFAACPTATKPAAEPSLPAVTLLKPLHHAEPKLRDNLETLLAQDYPGAIQIVLGAGSSDDTAIPVAEAFQADHPQADIVLVTGERTDAANPKIANLQSMLPAVRHDILILSDSDIAVPRHYLREVMACLRQPGVGCVTCLYRGVAMPNAWSRLSAMAITYRFLPNVLLGMALGIAKPCFGSTIAMARSTLDAIGGFERFADCLADDYAIGEAVRGSGKRVVLAPLIVSHICTEKTAGAFFHHELRWARTLRAINPIGYAGSVITHALPLGLAAMAILGFSSAAMAAFAAILAGRLVLKWRMDRICGDEALPAWLLPLSDMVSFCVFGASFFTRTVQWRGRLYAIRAESLLTRG